MTMNEAVTEALQALDHAISRLERTRNASPPPGSFSIEDAMQRFRLLNCQARRKLSLMLQAGIIEKLPDWRRYGRVYYRLVSPVPPAPELKAKAVRRR